MTSEKLSHRTGEELIATAGAVAFAVARCMDNKELTDFAEVLGLLKHNIDIIRFRRFLQEKKP